MERGGIARFSEDIYRALAADHRIDLVQTIPPTSNSPATITSTLADLRRQARWFRQIRPDIVISCRPALLPRGRGRRPIRVVIAYDALAITDKTEFNWLKRLTISTIYRWSLRSADVVACISAATRDEVSRVAPHFVSKSIVIGLGVSEKLRAATPVRPRGMESIGRFALVVGDLSPRKNFETICRAFSSDAVPDALYLVRAGPKGWGVERGRHELNQLVKAGRACDLGGVSDAELRWLYENCLALLAPSRIEGFDLPVAEGLHFGAKVIASDISVHREVGGDDVEYVDATDSGAWAASLKFAWSEAGRSKHAPSRSWTWGEVAERLLEAVTTETVGRRV